MKFHSENSLQDFEFHDAQMEFCKFVDGQLTVAVEHLNIRESAPQNDYGIDMEIAFAQIIFEGFAVKTYRAGGSIITDTSRNCILVEPIVELKGEEDGIYYIDSTAMWSAEFTFDTATVAWDEFTESVV